MESGDIPGGNIDTADIYIYIYIYIFDLSLYKILITELQIVILFFEVGFNQFISTITISASTKNKLMMINNNNKKKNKNKKNDDNNGNNNCISITKFEKQ